MPRRDDGRCACQQDEPEKSARVPPTPSLSPSLPPPFDSMAGFTASRPRRALPLGHADHHHMNAAHITPATRHPPCCGPENGNCNSPFQYGSSWCGTANMNAIQASAWTYAAQHAHAGTAPVDSSRTSRPILTVGTPGTRTGARILDLGVGRGLLVYKLREIRQRYAQRKFYNF